jgi:hypothetical protein
MTTRQNLVAFLLTGVASAIAFWYCCNWWVYVEYEDGSRLLKFEMPWWVQLSVSSTFGIIVGGCLVSIIALAGVMWKK